jgi:hypothetical protein
MLRAHSIKRKSSYNISLELLITTYPSLAACEFATVDRRCRIQLYALSTSLEREAMNSGQRQVIAEKIGSTVRVLELLGFEYTVSKPKNQREKGNKSPRVIYVDVGQAHPLRIYNSMGGHTWANEPTGRPIAQIGSIEDLYDYLYEMKHPDKNG